KPDRRGLPRRAGHPPDRPPGHAHHPPTRPRPEPGGPRVTHRATEAEAPLPRRRGGSTRHRQRILSALDKLTGAGEEISVAAVARAAGVDRSFLYRHHDLRAHILERAPPAQPAASM